MSEETPRIPCPNCGIQGDVADPQSSQWQCPGCGEGFFLRRCAACARVGYVDANQGHRTPWRCTWCGQPNLEFRQDGDPAAASAGALATEIGILGQDMLQLTSTAPMSVVGSDPGPGEGPGPGTAVDGDLVPFEAVGPPSAGARKRRRGSAIAIVAAFAVAVAVVAAGVLVLHKNGMTGGTASGHPETGRTAGGKTPAPGSPANTAPAPAPARSSQAATPAPGATSTGTLVSQTEPQAISVTATQARAAVISGVQGNLSVVGSGTGTGPVKLTGSLNWTGQQPTVSASLDRATGTLTVTVRCAAASSCTENLRLSVPSGTATTLRQNGGAIVLADVAGSLTLDTTGASITGTGLRSADLTARLSSGQLDATFAAAPSQIAATLNSADATIRLPATTGYQVTQDVSSGNVNVEVPQAGGTGHSVLAQLTSSELDLLSS